MEEKIKELTLLLLYLTSWKEDVGLGEVDRSWKGYTFKTLDDLTDEELIYGSKKSKSIYFTEFSIKEAEFLVNSVRG